MATLMSHIFFLLTVFARVQNSSVNISSIPSTADGPITWHQTVTIYCSWVPGNRMYGDMAVKGEEGAGRTIWNDPLYGDIVGLEDPLQRLYLSINDDEGSASLTIKDVTAEDSRTFVCTASRRGTSDPLTLHILEPPATGVSNFTATPEFTSVTLSWDLVDGATVYNVGWRPLGVVDWTSVVTPNTSHTFEGLNVASRFEAKVDASNAAGIREGIEPAEITFTTKDNRPPHPVDDLVVEPAAYNQTKITVSWNLDVNTAESRVVTGIRVSVGDSEGREEGSQDLDGSATSATFQLRSPGEYVFTVTTLNDFSEGVETSREVSHLVKKTTDPPLITTQKLTTLKPTTKKPTTEKPATKIVTTQTADDPSEESTENSGNGTDPLLPILVTEPVVATEAPSRVTCGPYRHLTSNPGMAFQLVCLVPENADYTAEQIDWSFKVAEGQVGQGQIYTQGEIEKKFKGVSITTDTNSSTLHGDGEPIFINEHLPDASGTFTCKDRVHQSTCIYSVKRPKNSGIANNLNVLLIAIFFLACF